MDIAKLDSAYCNRTFRPEFHELAFIKSAIRIYELPFNFSKGYIHLLQFHAWLQRRNISVSSFTFSPLTPQFYKLYKRYLKNHGPNIESIDIAVDNQFPQKPGSSTFNLIDRHCTAVKNISLEYCSIGKEGPMKLLFRNLHQLQSLTIKSSGDEDEIKDEAYRGIVTSCPSLRHLSIIGSHISSEHFAMLLERSPDLQTLDLDECIELNFSEVASVGEFCRKLTTLRVSQIHVDDYSLIAVAHNCPLLTSLCVEDCPDTFVSDVTVLALAEQCPLLEDLQLLCLGDISGAALIRLANKCPRLRSLCLRRCDTFSDQVLLAIAAHCKSFRELEITRSVQVTDQGLLALHRGCPLLESVTLNLTAYADLMFEESTALYGEKLVCVDDEDFEDDDADEDEDDELDDLFDVEEGGV